MKKLVLVVAMFMFVCGGSFLVKAQSAAKAEIALPVLNATFVQDTVINDTVAPKDKPVETASVAPAAFVNDTVVNDTASINKPGWACQGIT